MLEEVSPRAFCAWNRRFPERTVVDASTDIVVEGYPSAANSLVRQVLLHTQPGLRMASHLHSPAHVVRAVELGVPTLILLRPPVESVASLMARYPERRLDPVRELDRYQRFYSTVLARTDRVAVARFEDTVSSLSAVIEEVNKRFGTSFAAFADDDADLFERVFASLDYWTERAWGDRFEVVTPRPSPARSEANAAARAQIEKRAPTGQLAGCRALHDHLAGIASGRLEPESVPAVG